MKQFFRFGNSSLSCLEEFKKMREIILSDPDRKTIVVSAIEKRNPEDNKITNLVYLAYQHTKYPVDFNPLFEEKQKRYWKTQKELHLKINLEEEFTRIKH